MTAAGGFSGGGRGGEILNVVLVPILIMLENNFMKIDWGCSLVVEHLPSMLKVFGFNL